MTGTANSFISAQGLQTAQAHLTAAKTTYTDATNALLLFTAGANGAVLYGMTAIAPGSNGGAGRVDVFSSLNGILLHFIRSVNFASYSQSTTAGPVLNDMGWTESSGRRLAPLEQIWVSTSIAATGGMDVDAQYENL